MYDTFNAYRALGQHQQTSRITDHNTRLVYGALHRFEKALSEGRLRRFLSRLVRRTNRLIFLGDYPLKISGQYSAGIKEIQISEIRGSEGRVQDFDSQFRPLSERLSERWTSIAIARCEGVGLPPVELVRVGRYYFVRDGHHRISVARKFGQECIEAEVTVLQVDGPLPWEQTASPQQIKVGNGVGYGANIIGG